MTPPETLDLGSDGGFARLILPGDVAPSGVDAIREFALWHIQIMRGLAEELHVPFPRLEIWMLDITDSLTALASRVKGPPVIPGDVERVGGHVAGKTMPLEDDWSRAAVVSPGLGLASDDGRVKAIAAFSLLHEIGHAVVERLGTLSGAREIGFHPTNHSRRKAGNAVRHGLDEWRVSSIASTLLRGKITNAEGDEVSIPDLMGGTYRSALDDVLARAYPGWPDAVTRRQQGEMLLEAMYAQVVGETVEVFTYLSHCEAENMMLQRVTPLRDEYATHPATRLYLGEPWAALVDCDAPLLAPLSEFAAAEGTYISEVVPKIIEMWERVGLTFIDGPGPYDLWIDVTDPERDTVA